MIDRSCSHRPLLPSSADNKGERHGLEFTSPTADHGQGHARIQTWRAHERPRRKGRQGKEPPAGGCDCAGGSGSSKYESQRRNRRNLRRTEGKEAAGRTGQQEQEGKSHIGARGKRESTRSMGGKNARRPTARGKHAARARSRSPDGHTRKDLYAKARRRGIEGRSKMTKRQLENALGLH